MEIKVKIVELLPEKSGESANGTWRKQEYILETDSQYPKKVCFMAWGEKIDQFAIKRGEDLVVSVDLEKYVYRISRSSKNSLPGSTPVTKRCSLALVHATYSKCLSVS